MIKANPIIFDQIVITHLRFPSQRLCLVIYYVWQLLELLDFDAFKIFLVMYNCYIDFKYYTNKRLQYIAGKSLKRYKNTRLSSCSFPHIALESIQSF